MPKELTHIVFADAVAARLPESGAAWLAGLLTAMRAPYHAGSLAPDVFYYGLDRRDGARHLGAIVHGDNGEDTAAAVIEMLRRLRAGGDHAPEFAAQVAFAAGYLTHMALDMTFHPWIYAVTGQYYAADASERHLAMVRHRLLETWLDVHMLARRRGPGIPEQIGESLAAIRRRRRWVNAALVLWGESFARVHRIDRPLGSMLKRRQRRQLFVVRRYRSPVLGGVLRQANRVFGGRLASLAALFHPPKAVQVPRGILDHEGFNHPVTGLYQEGGVDHLWEQAIGRAVEFLGAVDRYLIHGGDIAEMTQHIHGYSLSMGLPECVTAHAQHFQPLPLEVLQPKTSKESAR